MSVCRSCGAPVRWVTVASTVGTWPYKAMPVDAEAVEGGNVEVAANGLAIVHGQPELDPQGPRYVSHFATCPQAGEWRR